MKHDWRKDDQRFYMPLAQPQVVQIPEFKFFIINGQGNPNDDFFAEYIKVLYTLSYAVKMSPKKGTAPKNYVDYTIFPLEGIWTLDEEGIKSFDGVIDKSKLVFNLMIRQPDFVAPDFAAYMLEHTKKNKPHELLEQVRFEAYADGNCVQMLHVGSYDNEPESFMKMEQFIQEQGYNRKSKAHREIYLSDARKVSQEKLKTVLRFEIAKLET